MLGGGSMDISSTLNSPNPAATAGAVVSPNVASPTARARHRPSHSRSSSFSAGLLSILSSPTSLVSSLSSPNANGGSSARWRSPSSFTPATTPSSGRFPNSTSSPSVLGLAAAANGMGEVDPEIPLPTFEIQPAMLGVDLSLAPGESRSCE